MNSPCDLAALLGSNGPVFVAFCIGMVGGAMGGMAIGWLTGFALRKWLLMYTEAMEEREAEWLATGKEPKAK
jgi:Na+/citrate or Na+/malate symporter